MSALLAAARSHRAALLEQDANAAARMARAYAVAYETVRADLLALLEMREESLRAGLPLTVQQKLRLWRLQVIKGEVEAHLRGFASVAGDAMDTSQRWAVAAAQRNARQMLLDLSADPRVPDAIRLGLARPNTEAVEQLVGFAGDGSPLRALLVSWGEETAQNMTDVLAQGVLVGQDARTLASRLRDAADIGLARAQTIARTEMMRAYREASHLQYQANADNLAGWVWHAGLGPRCCAACVAMHGTLHTTEERLDDHPRGRCVAVPIPKGMAPADFGIQEGEEWLTEQPELVQRRVIGTRRGYDAWRSGEVDLSDFVGRRRSEQWGTMRYRRSARDAIAAAA